MATLPMRDCAVGSTLFGTTYNRGGFNAGTLFSLSFVPTVGVTASAGSDSYTVGAAGVVIDSGLTVVSSDTNLTGATVSITNWQSSDSLHFTNQNGISIASNTAGV